MIALYHLVDESESELLKGWGMRSLWQYATFLLYWYAILTARLTIVFHANSLSPFFKNNAFTAHCNRWVSHPSHYVSFSQHPGNTSAGFRLVFRIDYMTRSPFSTSADLKFEAALSNSFRQRFETFDFRLDGLFMSPHSTLVSNICGVNWERVSKTICKRGG